MKEIGFMKDSMKLMDKIEMDLKKISALKANQSMVEKIHDKLFHQTPTLKQHDELKKFAEKEIKEIKDIAKSFQKKTDRFRIDQGRLNDRNEIKFKDFDDVIEQTELKVHMF